MTKHDWLSEVLDDHGEWYVRRTIRMLKEHKDPSFVTGLNAQDKKAHKLISAHEIRERLDELQDMQDGYKAALKKIANPEFAEVVSPLIKVVDKRLADLTNQLKELEDE